VARRGASADQSVAADQPATPRSGSHARAALPTDLIDAIAALLEREAAESDVQARAELLSRVRGVVEALGGGGLTIEQAIDALGGPPEAKSGIGLRRIR
jgi:hypothetical protein